MFLSATSTTSIRKQKPLLYFVLFLSCLIIPWQAWSKPTAKAPLIDISTCTDLQNMRSNLAGQYTLTGDVDCTGVNFSPIGTTTSNPFTGSLDGAGFKVKNLSIQSTNDYVGLFGAVNNARISRLTLENVQISGKSYVGALVGSTTGGSAATTISQVKAQGNVTSTQGGIYVGGLVGWLNTSSSSIQDSSASVIVEALSTSSHFMGGLVGYLTGGTINRSYATGAVRGGSYDIGGLAGNSSGSVTKSYATGAVRGSGDSVGGLLGVGSGGNVTGSYATGSVNGGGKYIGGLVGYYFAGNGVIDCYATGTVSGSSYTGGLAGYLNAGGISNSYAIGAVTGIDGTGGLVGYKTSVGVLNSYAAGSVSGNTVNTGGLIGAGSSANVTNSYWDTQTSGQATSLGGIGKTTAQMYQQSTYTGWDFAAIWNIHEGKSYPWLRSTANEIKNCADLQNVQQNLSGVHRLVGDIDCTGVALSPIGNSQQPFTGTLDGDGYAIANVEIKSDGQPFIGLFSTTQGAQIVDVVLRNIYVSGQRITGALVGYAFGDTQISGISADGLVEAKGSSNLNNIGGLIGVLAEGSINHSSAAITVNAGSANIVGGLIGQNSGLVWNSYALGAISGAGNVGGLVGDNTGTLNNTYSIGKVAGTSNTGGLVGSGSGLAASSYWDTQTSGQSTSASGVGKTTAEMYQQSTYVGWDFKNIWNIFNGYTYPWLRDQVGKELMTKLK